jgi:uncharacterized protein
MQGISSAFRASVALDQSRIAFLRKTYLHLLGAILALVAFEAYLFQSGAALRVAQSVVSTNWLIVLAGFGIVSWLARSAAHKSRSKGVQYAALAGYVVAWGLMLAPVLYIAQMKVGGGVIESAAGITVVGFAALTGVVFVTKKDFTFMGSILRWGGLCALGLIVAATIFGFNLGVFFSIAMIALAGGSILFDTHNILNNYEHDRYVGASLELFASIVMLFWYVLRLLMRSRD